MLKLTDVAQALPRMKTGADLTDALQILPKYDAYIREQDAATRLTALSELYRIYRPSTDEIILPIRKQFVSTAEYYSTVWHELVHSTGHPSRLNRLDRVVAFGSDVYSKEELVAEIGAATLVNHVGLETTSSFRNSAAYIQNWLKVLKDDKRFIVSAAGRAEKAVNLILNQ